MINNLRYADDTVIIAETELQQLMDIVVQESELKSLYSDFTIVFSKSAIIPDCTITVHGKHLNQVNKFIPPGSLFTSDGRCKQDE